MPEPVTISGDVGQVMFGQAATVTADAPVEYLLHQSSGRKWANLDIELETGCGVVPPGGWKRGSLHRAER